MAPDVLDVGGKHHRGAFGEDIFIEAGEYPEGDKRRGYERFPVKFVIDELRCIFCGYCVEACPCDAIRMDTGMHAVPYDSRDQFIYDRDLLLSIEGQH